ncbi:MAG: flippase-like domain-containing protein [bacterium]|nr:flippase-like domain-containing protein [bacterium]
MIGLLLGILFLWLSLRHVEWARVRSALGAVDLLLFLAAFLVGQTSNWVRACRWRLLLARPVPVGGLFAATMIGYFANFALPARLGELFRVERLKRAHGVPRGRGLASLVAEKVLDGLTLCVILGGILLVNDFPAWVSWVAYASFALFGGALMAILVFLRYRQWALALVRRLLSPFGRLSTSVLHFAESAAEGLETLRRPASFISSLLLSFAVWAIETVAVWTLLRAAGLDLGLEAALFVVTILSLGMLVPSPPGFVGTYEYFGSRALGLLAVDASAALAATFLLHLQFLFATVVVGVACLLWTGVGFGALREGVTEE